MDFTSILTGSLATLFVIALFQSKRELEIIDDIEDEVEEDSPGLSNRLHQMFCGSCRALRRHREIEPKVYSCCKCNRRTYLNAS
jgi:hypothetical protein